jgi:serine/threonine protein kinase
MLSPAADAGDAASTKKRKVDLSLITRLDHLPVNDSHRIGKTPKYDYPPQSSWVELGRGTFGVVYATSLIIVLPQGAVRSFEVAVKRIPRKSFQLSELRRMQMLSKKSAHVVRVFDFWEDEVYVYLVLEKLCDIVNRKGKLQFKMIPLHELLRQMLVGLRDCHAAGFVHGDFKPSNIMVNNNRVVKLIDWDDTAFDPKYARSDNASSRRSSKERDLFAYAVSAYELIVGFLPDWKKLFIPNRIETSAKDFIMQAFKLADSPGIFYATLLAHPYLSSSQTHQSNGAI